MNKISIMPTGGMGKPEGEGLKLAPWLSETLDPSPSIAMSEAVSLLDISWQPSKQEQFIVCYELYLGKTKPAEYGKTAGLGRGWGFKGLDLWTTLISLSANFKCEFSNNRAPGSAVLKGLQIFPPSDRLHSYIPEDIKLLPVIPELGP